MDPVSSATEHANHVARFEMPCDWTDSRDQEFSRRGLITRGPCSVIPADAGGPPAWDGGAYRAFLTLGPPASGHPSLLRLAPLHRRIGLFRVTDGGVLLRG